MSTAPTKLAPSATQAPESEAPSATEAPEPASAQQRAVADYSGYRIVAAKHPWRWVGTVVVALGVAAILWSLITNPGGNGMWWRSGLPRSPSSGVWVKLLS